MRIPPSNGAFEVAEAAEAGAEAADAACLACGAMTTPWSLMVISIPPLPLPLAAGSTFSILIKGRRGGVGGLGALGPSVTSDPGSSTTVSVKRHVKGGMFCKMAKPVINRTDNSANRHQLMLTNQFA